MEKDLSLKMIMSQIFWHWGYLPLIDVKLVRPDTSVTRTDRGELTDIDVLGIKFLPEYRVIRTAADCTTRNRGAMGRAFWLRGILDLIGAEDGYVLADPNKRIQQDHKASSRQIKITLLDPTDARLLLDRLKLFNQESVKINLFTEQAHQYLEGNILNQKVFQEALNYRKYRYWQDTVNEQILNTISIMKDIAPKVILKDKWHFSIIFEYFFLFSVAAIDLTWRVAPFISPNNPETVDLQLRYFIYGGEKYYNSRVNIVKFIQQKLDLPRNTLGDNLINNIAPPEWKLFLETYVRLLINPTAAVYIPQVLKLALFEKFLYQNSTGYSQLLPPQANEFTFKLIGDLARYFCAATKLPKDFVQLVEEFTSIDTEPKPHKTENDPGAVRSKGRGPIVVSKEDTNIIPETTPEELTMETPRIIIENAPLSSDAKDNAQENKGAGSSLESLVDDDKKSADTPSK